MKLNENLSNAISKEDKNYFSKCIAKQLKLNEYVEIRTVIAEKKIDVSDETEEAKKFRKTYKDYFGIRRDNDWCHLYFTVLDKWKDKDKKDLTFESCLQALNDEIDAYNNSNNEEKQIKKQVELSYISKLLAVIDNDLPIYDKNVRINLGMKTVAGSIDIAKKNYEILKDVYYASLPTSVVNNAVNLFYDFFPIYKDNNIISNVKIIDYYLWSMSQDELRCFGLVDKDILRKIKEIYKKS